MWIFGRHRHLSPEALSEYLDGHLRGAQRQRVSRQVNSCASCQDELESLRATISLLRDLPDTPAPRSFTLAGPPRVVATQSAPRPFRAPSWAYAGAASLAGLALAVLVSADVTGLFTPTGVSGTPEPFTTQALQAPASTPAPQPTPAPATTAPQPESMQALRAAEAPEVDAQPSEEGAIPEADQPPTSEREAGTGAAAAPSAATAEDAGAAGGPSGPTTDEGGLLLDDSDKRAAAPNGEDATAFAQSEQPAEEITEVPTSEPDPVSEFAAEEEMGTPLVWRVLEGVVAALLLVFLTVLVLQRRKAPPSVKN
jgi:hypothetical protein